ncbi:MAG TPA: polysaccharide deacetylase family protein [Solirubrobacteraceae bacterium]|nr:polysaccharide deacetylase family protein [Solirubrobacteraceae bacterium]
MAQITRGPATPNRDHPHVIRHALAPVSQASAAGLNLPRTITTTGAGVALTFDDGPHPEGTPAVLETLARAGARATFFVVGEQVQRRPALVAEIAAAGHLVALHGYRHRLQLLLGGGAVRADIERGIESIREAAGLDVAWHRPPYGVYSPGGLKFVREAGLRPLLWSRWGKDWRKFTTPSRIAARATREIGPGDVILLHDADFYSARDSHRRTAEALKTILSRLSHAGLDTVLPD